jgi:hypothetical protein
MCLGCTIVISPFHEEQGRKHVLNLIGEDFATPFTPGNKIVGVLMVLDLSGSLDTSRLGSLL